MDRLNRDGATVTTTSVVDSMRDIAIANTVVTAAQCLAGVFVIVVVRQVTAWQAVPRRA